jgi:cytochrome P450
MLDSARQYGDIVVFPIGSERIFSLSHPDYVEQVLVTSYRQFVKSRGLKYAKRILGEGLLTSEREFHLRQRRLIQPAFHRRRIAQYARVMVDYAARARVRWQDGVTLDIHEEMMRLTLAIVGKTLFDADVRSEAGEIGEALTASLQMFKRLNQPFGEVLDRLPLPSNRRFRRAQERLDATIYRIIEERRASGRDHGDLLSMLLQAEDDDRTPMSPQQVRDEAMTLFLAGHETTANALTWAWYLLSQNPAVEAKLQAEVDAVLGHRLPTVEDLPQLSYTEKVLTESMRLYPPAWVIGRETVGDYMLDGVRLPAHSMILMSQYVVHRDPRYFSEPDQFEPERWTPEFKAALPRFAYFPFGGGPRVCIGEPFAWTEGILLLATLAQQWQMRLAPGQRIALLPQITLRPKYGMRMILERRKTSNEST